MNLKNAFLVAGLIVVVLSPVSGQNDAAQPAESTNAKNVLRVALVTDSRASPETKALLDLATAELSQNEDVHLLERADVQRVLAEQKLSQTGLASDRQALALGKILKADLFLAIETDVGEKWAFAAIAFDAKTGVRLRESPLSPNIDKASQQLTEFVKASVRKRRQIGRESKAIGFVSMRNADLPRDWDTRCQAIGRLLERRVLETDGITVLERHRLENVTREQALAVEGPERDLWASVVLIDLQVGRGSTAGSLKLSAQLKTIAGQVLKTLSVECAVATPDFAADKMLPELRSGFHRGIERRRQLGQHFVGGDGRGRDRALHGQRLEDLACDGL